MSEQLPQSVVIIRRIFDCLLLTPARAAFSGITILSLFSLAWALYTIEVGATGALQRFGKMIYNNAQPGIHGRIPWWVDKVTSLRTGQIFRTHFTKDVNSFLTLLTGDENIIEIQLVAQYRITDIGDFLFGADQPVGILRGHIQASLINGVATKTVDWVLARGKHDLQKNVTKAVQRKLDTTPIGVTLVSINLVSIDPPPEAQAAFRDVNDAKSDKLATITNAITRKDRTIAHAKGAADAIVGDAHAEADARIELAAAAVKRFNLILAEKRSSPEQTIITQYRKMARKIIGRAKIMVVAPDQASNLGINILEDGVFSPPQALRQAAPAQVAHASKQLAAAGTGQVKKEKKESGHTSIGKALHEEGAKEQDRKAGAGMHSETLEAHHLGRSEKIHSNSAAHQLNPKGGSP